MIVIALLGLFLPGYLLACALRSRWTWVAAFPLSVVLLTETVIVYTMLGVPLQFANVAVALAVVSAICAAIWLRRASAPLAPEKNEPRSTFGALPIITAAVVGLTLLGLLVRTSMYPLSGFDTVFRWDGLARAMLKYHSLSYYPPVTADDFTKYIYPDGFPPLVATVYWWLYAAWGEPLPAITSVVVLLQVGSCLALAFYAADLLFGYTGALLSVAVLACASLFLHALAIGQETGYTAVSCAGQLTFALLATQEDNAQQRRWNSVVIAGIFAGLAALAREYGPLLGICGFAVLACHRSTLRFLPLYVLVAAVSGGLWYVRSWLLTENPLYPIDIGLGLPANPVYAELLKAYHEAMGLPTFSASEWFKSAVQLLAGAPLVLLLGPIGLFLSGRHAIALALAAAATIFLWLWSIPYTAGGVNYSMRVLAPAWIALAVAAGALGRWLDRPANRWNTFAGRGICLAILLGGCYAVACSWSHPFSPDQIAEAVVTTRSNPLDSQDADVVLAKALSELHLPQTQLLTDSCYFAAALQQYTQIQPVMIWSPAVVFVFDKKLTPLAVRQRLLEQGVGLVELTKISVNNLYLGSISFYRQDGDHWSTVAKIENIQAVYALPTEVPVANPATP